MTRSRRAVARSLVLALTAAAAALAPAGAADANSIRTPTGVSPPVDAPALTDTTTPAGAIDISSDGRLIAYASNRPDAAPGVDTNQAWDLFAADLISNDQSVRLPLVSGGQANGDSFDPSISGDGRYVASSRAPPTSSRTTPTGSRTSSSSTATPTATASSTRRGRHP